LTQRLRGKQKTVENKKQFQNAMPRKVEIKCERKQSTLSLLEWRKWPGWERNKRKKIGGIEKKEKIVI